MMFACQTYPDADVLVLQDLLSLNHRLPIIDGPYDQLGGLSYYPLSLP